MSTIRFPNPSEDEYDDLIKSLDEIPDPPERAKKKAKAIRRRLFIGALTAAGAMALGVHFYRRRLKPIHYFPLSSDLRCEATELSGAAKGDVTFPDNVIRINGLRDEVTLPQFKITEEWSILFWVRFAVIRRLFDSEEEERAHREKYVVHYRPFLYTDGWGIFFKDGQVVVEKRGRGVIGNPCPVESASWTLCHFRVPATISELTLSSSNVSDITIWDRVITERELADFRTISRNEYRQQIRSRLAALV